MPRERAAPRLTAANVIGTPSNPVESAKREAARRAVDEWVKDGMAVGVGSGSTIVYAIQRLAERVQNEGLDIICVPTSFQSRNVSMVRTLLFRGRAAA
jgi:ribose 5-phosphate isomerase